MQVTVENVNSVKKIIHVEIPESSVSQELDNAYNQIKKTAKIKGFRPGKVPRNVIERLFKKEVHADVSSKLIQDSLIQAIKENDLRIVGSPKVDPQEINAKVPFKYEATVEVSPKIEDLDFKGLTLKKNLYEASDAEVDVQLKLLQKNTAQLKTIEEKRPVQKGDYVLIDYEGFKDGKPFPELGKTDNFTLKVGNKVISQEFDDQLAGMNPGESKRIGVHFPPDHANKNMANQKIEFKTILKEIREEILPNIDDDFAKDLGDYKNLEELKNKILENLKSGYEKRAEQELNEQIFRALIDKTNFEVPEVLVETELEGIISDAERSFQYRNATLEDMGLSREKIALRYRETAEKQVRRYLILDKIIDQEKLTLSDEELESEMKKMAETVKQSLEDIKQFYNHNKDRLDAFKHGLLEKKAMRLIIDSSKIEETRPEREKPVPSSSESKE
ncbi:MAG: trigger factor [Deltaproteobacteria bacterium RBG_13_49_15]|nr:MAG: trigger factor [Deltaproteobacteria bacterium RBG_13_49_15]